MPILFLISVLLSGQLLAADRIAFMRESGDKKAIYLFENESLKEVPSEAPWNLYPTLTSDGRHLAYVSTGPTAHNTPNSSIRLRALGTDRLEQWTSGKDFSIHPSFSRNGNFLAYSAPLGQEGTHHIAILDLNQERSKGAEYINGILRYDIKADPRVLPSNEHCYFPALSQDGDFVVYQRNRLGRREIVRRDLKTDKITILSTQSEQSRSPALSPDDRYVAFASKAKTNWDIYLYDLEQRTQIRLTFDKGEDFAPAFRSDGTLVFASNRRGSFEIYDVNYALKGPVGETPLISVAEDRSISLYAPAASGELSLRKGRLSDLPQPARSSFGTARIGTRIFIAGGHAGKEHTYPPESFLKRFEVFNPSTGRWRRLRNRPIAAHGYGLAAYRHFIYAFGGFQYSAKHIPKWRSSDLIHRYNRRTNRWRTVGRLPRRRSSNVVAQVGHLVYLIGGWDATPRFEKDYEGTFHREIDLFNLKTGQITPNVAQLPDPLRRALSGTVLGNTIHIMGGITKGGSHFNLVDAVSTFDTETKKWGKLPKLPFATFAPAGGTLNGTLWMFGGMRKVGKMDYQYLDSIYRLDPKSGWVHVGRTLMEKKGFSQVVDYGKNTLILLGGHSYDNGDAPTKTIEWMHWNTSRNSP